MKMLERAAREAAEKRGCGNSQFANCQGVCGCRVTARAVIRSIREPDEEVIEAMRSKLAERDACLSMTKDGLNCGAACWCRITALAIWQAGIDKIMEERNERVAAD